MIKHIWVDSAVYVICTAVAMFKQKLFFEVSGNVTETENMFLDINYFDMNSFICFSIGVTALIKIWVKRAFSIHKIPVLHEWMHLQNSTTTWNVCRMHAPAMTCN